MCGSMVDIQCAALRLGEEKKKIETTGLKYNGAQMAMATTK